MALMTYYGPENRVIEVGKTVSYGRRRVPGVWSYFSSAATIETVYSAWQYTRECAMTIRYVGMTESAALQCAADMIDFYTRTVAAYDWEDAWMADPPADRFIRKTQLDATILMADVSPVHNEDGSYDVLINLREQDDRLSQTLMNASSAFPEADQREYDDGSLD